MWFNHIFALVLCLYVTKSLAADLPLIEVVGNKFFYSNNGSQFLIRGVAYQQNNEDNQSKSYSDPLADADACERDVKYLRDANTNVIRVYAVDPKKDHDKCMLTFADAGIYVIADLSEPKTSINRDSPEWSLDLYDRYTSVIDMFSKYDNVLGFFAGNEVTNNKSNTDAAAFVKAAIRDSKKYIKGKKLNLPVGYSTDDSDDTRDAVVDYFACGSDEDRADFIGVNMYEWCGNSDFKTSGYEARTKLYLNLTIPIFMSEYGCNTDRPRKFTEVGTIFSDKMTDVWSGGIVYMYFEEANEYGLVSVKGDTVLTLDDYKYYSLEMNKISPSYAKSSEEKLVASKTGSCPASASTWKASTKLPPTPDKDTCDCMSKSLACTVADDVDEKDYGDLFGVVCDKIDCDSINADGAKGKYGGFSFCSSKDKLSYVMNAYYEDQGKDKSACDFKGSASLNENASTDKTCSSKLSQASKGGSSSSGSGSSSSGSSGDSNSSSGSSTNSVSSASSSKKLSGSVNIKFVSHNELFAVAGVVTCILGGLSFVVLE